MAQRKDNTTTTPIKLTKGWVEGLNTCGLGVAVHKDHGLVVNLYTGDIINGYIDRVSGAVMIKVPVNLGTNRWISKSTRLRLARVVLLVLSEGKVPKELAEISKVLWVYHKNGNKRDNHPSNLEWATPRMALLDKLEMGSLNTKLEFREVKAIRQVATAMNGTKDGIDYAALAQAFQVSAGHVKNILSRKTNPEGPGTVWKHWDFIGQPDASWESPAPIVDKIRGACTEIQEYNQTQKLLNENRSIDNY